MNPNHKKIKFNSCCDTKLSDNVDERVTMNYQLLVGFFSHFRLILRSQNSLLTKLHANSKHISARQVHLNLMYAGIVLPTSSTSKLLCHSSLCGSFLHLFSES